jgi:CRP/FNR family transcriptional regulator
VNRTQLHFKKGEIICKQGAYASNILFLYEGSAKNYLEVSNGKNNIISVLPQGEMIGLPSLFSARIYPYSAAALEDCIVCSIDITLFEELVKTNGSFAGAVIKCLNNSTIQNYDRYIFNKQRPLKGRLAEILLHLTEDIYRSHEFKLTLSRNDLAEWTQMAPESVTRIFTNFKKEKLISIKGKSIIIKDIEGLRQLSLLD